MKKILYLIVFFSFSITHAHESGGSEVVPCSVEYEKIKFPDNYRYVRSIYMTPSMTFIGAHFSVPDNGRDISIPVIIHFKKSSNQMNGYYIVEREKGSEKPNPDYFGAKDGIWSYISEEEFQRKLKLDYCEIIY